MRAILRPDLVGDPLSSGLHVIEPSFEMTRGPDGHACKWINAATSNTVAVDEVEMVWKPRDGRDA